MTDKDDKENSSKKSKAGWGFYLNTEIIQVM